MIETAVVALGVLVLLAVLIGRMLDRQAQDAAWRRIATARRINAARARDLDDQQTQLHEIEDALAARARRLEFRDPPSSGVPTDRPCVGDDAAATGGPDPAA